MGKRMIEDIILKYLQNNLTKSEASRLAAWLEEDARHRQVFENIVGEWRLSTQDIQESKERVHRRIYQERPAKGMPQTASRTRKYLARAAAILLLLGASWAIWNTWHPSEIDLVTKQPELIEKTTPGGQKATYELPDGTLVTLNAGSTLRYPSAFATDHREVSLIGEGFFKVMRDEQSPFRITSSGAEIQVLGTSFNVRAYPEDPFTQVAVKTGRVSVRGHQNEGQVVLNPHEMTVYSAEHQLSKVYFEEDAGVFGWIQQELVFRDEQAAIVLKRISRWYGVQFDLPPGHALDSIRTFTATYKQPTLQEVLKSVSYTYNFTYTMEGKTVRID